RGADLSFAEPSAGWLGDVPRAEISRDLAQWGSCKQQCGKQEDLMSMHSRKLSNSRLLATTFAVGSLALGQLLSIGQAQAQSAWEKIEKSGVITFANGSNYP